MKGQIPVTDFMILESNEDQWKLISNGIISELRVTALININPDKKVRISLVINQVISPEQKQVRFNSEFKDYTGRDVKIKGGMERIVNFTSLFLEKKAWILIGYIDGENKNPIIIKHYSSINLTVYTQKLSRETTEFFSTRLASLN